MKTLIVIQARVASTRLPGKVLLPLAGRPLLERMLERVCAARGDFDLVVATTGSPDDDPIALLCARLGVACFRGHETDLLDRHYRAARLAGADVVVKIPSDCPLIDPNAIERVLEAYASDPTRYDYVSNLHPQSWPDGNDVEGMTMNALETAWREATRPWEREHTTPFIWEQPDRFRIGNVMWGHPFDYSLRYRFTIDYLEDYLVIEAVHDALWTETRPVFPLDDILAFVDAHPEIPWLNEHLAGVSWYRHHRRELTTVAAHRIPFIPEISAV